jgi:hypothetical protein
MKSSFAKVFASLAVALAFASYASAASVEYRILINGALPSGPIALAAGTHTLSVEGRVLDNDLAPSTPGGFLVSSFSLSDDKNAVVWEERQGFLGAATGTWNSTTNAAFGTHLFGTLTDNKTNVLEETGSIPSANWDAQFNAVGANQWSPIASGKFTFTPPAGNQPVVITLASDPTINSVATIGGTGVVGKSPATVVGASVTVGIPEPATFALAGLGLIGAFAARRRRS